MKQIFLAFFILSLMGCEKEHCYTATNMSGVPCCEKCFRTEEKMFADIQANHGKNDCADMCD